MAICRTCGSYFKGTGEFCTLQCSREVPRIGQEEYERRCKNDEPVREEAEVLKVKIMANYSLIEEIYIQREPGGDLDGFCDYRIRFPATEGLIKHWRPDGARVLVKKALDHLLS